MDTNNSVENNRVEYVFKLYQVKASIFDGLKESQRKSMSCNSCLYRHLCILPERFGKIDL